MSILIDKSTRLIVQGITGRDGLFHAKKMKEYGTNVVGGTSPGKGGTEVDGIPVFNTMHEAVKQTQANTSIIFVPARFAADTIMGSCGCRHPANSLYRRRYSDPGCHQSTSVCRTKRGNVGWPQLSGTYFSRRKYGRNPSGTSLSERKCRCHQP